MAADVAAAGAAPAAPIAEKQWPREVRDELRATALVRVASFPSKHKADTHKWSFEQLAQLARSIFPESAVYLRTTDFSWWRGHDSGLVVRVPGVRGDPARAGDGDTAAAPPAAFFVLLLLNKVRPEMNLGNDPETGEPLKCQGKTAEESPAGRRLDYTSPNGELVAYAGSGSQPDRRQWEDIGKNDFVLQVGGDGAGHDGVEEFLRCVGEVEGYSAEYVTRY